MKSKHFARIISENTPTAIQRRKMVKDYLDGLDKKDAETKKACQHTEHNFPTLLYIPSGQSHTHICPGCGNEITLTTPIL
jgi:hypothetical protein